MYLDVTFKDGSVTHIGVTNLHEVRIVGPDGKVQDAFAIDGVAEIALDPNGNPQATDPNPPVPAGAAEGPTPDPTQQAHDDAVAAAQTVVASVTGSDPQTVEPAAPETHAEILAAAQADVEQAIAQWPDSPQLQDAKAQLEQLAADQQSQ